MSKKFTVFYIISFLFTLAFSAVIFAKEVHLYDAPKSDAKITGAIDLSSGVVPIYTPKEGNWIKVGDPRNGNVGWIKTRDINASGSSTVTFTQHIFNDGKGPQTYQYVQYGSAQGNKLTPEQMQQLQKWEQWQQSIQQSMQNAYFHMMHEMENLYRQNFSNLGQFPIVMPVVVVPEQKQPQKAVVATTSTQIKPAPSAVASPTNPATIQK